LVQCSFIPWVSFSSFKHARNNKLELNGIPKFVIGKYVKEDEIIKMPFSIEVHHALMDGLHVEKLLEILQDKIDKLK
jgi:chloramphenicol O-acetyltransferase type A